MSLRFLALPAALVLAGCPCRGNITAAQDPQSVSIDEARNRISTDVAAMDASDGYIDAAERNTEHELRQAERQRQPSAQAQFPCHGCRC